MRTVFVLVSALLPSVSLADSVRHLSVPAEEPATNAPKAHVITLPSTTAKVMTATGSQC